MGEEPKYDADFFVALAAVSALVGLAGAAIGVLIFTFFF